MGWRGELQIKETERKIKLFFLLKLREYDVKYHSIVATKIQQENWIGPTGLTNDAVFMKTHNYPRALEMNQF